MTKYLHTMIRISSLEDSIAFFEVLGLREIRRRPDEGRYTNVFLAGDEAAALNSPIIGRAPHRRSQFRNSRRGQYLRHRSALHARGVTINRPSRRRVWPHPTPDGISIGCRRWWRYRLPNPGPAW